MSRRLGLTLTLTVPLSLAPIIHLPQPSASLKWEISGISPKSLCTTNLGASGAAFFPSVVKGKSAFLLDLQGFFQSLAARSLAVLRVVDRIHSIRPASATGTTLSATIIRAA